MRIYQLVNTLIKGDAIGNDTFALHKILSEYDNNTQILAINIGSNVHENYVKHLDGLDFVFPNDILIYHMCECSKISEWLKRVKCKKIAIYHNTTPASFFVDIDSQTFLRQKQSEYEIASLKEVFNLCIADSEFNKNDLVRLGYDASKIIVMPIIIPTYEYTDDSNEIDLYYNNLTNILFVGRIVPNKKQEDVIRAFTYYQRFFNKESRLILVGSPFTDMYLNLLKEYVNDLGTQNVVFKSGLSFKDLKRVYKSANLFLCMSEHEGFCVPLVEAMLFNIPVIAYGSSAIPETMGPDNCVINTKNPHIVAEYMDIILNNCAIRQRILDSQAKWVKRYNYQNSLNQCKDIIHTILNNSMNK